MCELCQSFPTNRANLTKVARVEGLDAFKTRIGHQLRSQRPCSNPLLRRALAIKESEGESAPFRRNGVKARSNDVQRCDLTDPVPMLALPLLQLMMLVSPTGRSPHGPAISASWRYAEPRCGACADFCIGRLGATQREAAKAESGLLPEVRDQFTESQAQRMCEVLQARLGLTKVELKTLVVRNSPVLGNSIEATVLPRLAALQVRLGLSEAELKKLVLQHPKTLGYNIEYNVLPSLAVLQARLGLSEAELKRMVLRWPVILGISTEDNLLPSLAALQARLGLNEAELKQLVLRAPSIVGISVDNNVLPSLAALQARLGLSEAELKRMVIRQPAILSMSIENNVLPTIDFLQGELSLSHSALRERIVGNPKMLSYSIERRLRPRVELCREMGVPSERMASMLFGYHSTKPEDFEEKCARASGRALHRLRGGARICTGKRTSNVTWATFPRSFWSSGGWYFLGVAMLGAFGLLWPENWKKSDSIEFALIGLVLMSLDALTKN